MQWFVYVLVIGIGIFIGGYVAWRFWGAIDASHKDVEQPGKQAGKGRAKK